MTIHFSTQPKPGFQVGNIALLQNSREEFIRHLLAALSVVRHRLHQDHRPVYLLANDTHPTSDTTIRVWPVALPRPEAGELAAVLKDTEDALIGLSDTTPMAWSAVPARIREQAICLAVTDASTTIPDQFHDEVPLLAHLVLTQNQASIQFPIHNRLVDEGDLVFVWSYWLTVYRQLTRRPGQSIDQLLLADMKRQKVSRGEGPNRPFDFTQPIHALFAQQCRQQGQNTAVIDVDAAGRAQAISYRTVQGLANQIAAKLAIPFTPVPGMGIGVCLERSHRVLAAMLGIWQAGEVYVPLESSLPDATLEQIINDAGISLVLTDAASRNRPFLRGVQTITVDELFPEDDCFPALAPSTDPKALAMIFYTSGSTGVPKGVMHAQMHLLNRFNWLWEMYPFREGDVTCQRTTLNFMPSMWELLGGVLRGVPVVVLPDAIVKDPVQFAAQLHQHQITCVNIVPSLLKMMREGCPDLETRLSQVRWWITCGEPLSVDMRHWLQKTFPQALLLNDHGATEVNGVLYYDSTHLTDDESIPYSLPVANVTIHILDEQKRPLPPYVPGELFVSGPCLALGYLDEALTRQKFIRASSGQVLFKLGDWGYFDKVGRIRTLGRMDNVVKVRGNRVDLTGVEQLLNQLDSIQDCVVLAEKDSEQAATITAFVVPRAQNLTASAVREKALALMPDYMVPQRFRLLDELPRLINGKVDRETLRKALRKPDEMPASTASITPLIDRDIYLNFCRQQAAELLDVSAADINFSRKFYEIGFNSASLVTFTNAINKRFGFTLRVSDLYNYPIVEDFLDYALGANNTIGVATAPTEESAAPSRDADTSIDTTPEIDFFTVPPFAPAATPAPVRVNHDQIETWLVKFACDVLAVTTDEISIDKKYYALGFTSASLVSFLAQINQHFGLTISVAIVYNNPSISELAGYIRQQTPNSTEAMPTLSEETDFFSADQFVATTPESVSIPDPIDFFAPLTSAGTSAAMEPVLAAATEPIAVIGLSGKFPNASDIQAFWELLSQGKSGITLVPANRWDYQAVFDGDVRAEGKTNSKWGGFVENIDQFDAAFFNISPMEASLMDPQQRLCLEESWKALENAGYDEESLQQKKVGIFMGMRPGDYQQALYQHDVSPSAYTLMGNDLAILSARLAYYLNLKGPAITVDTACSSSLVALHLAIQSIRAGDCEMALAGGVHLMATPSLHVTSAKMNMLSPDGQCKTFANSADGFVPGEGVGVVVLKPLRKAQLDGDLISGVIIGSGLNQDGRTNGITAPSGTAQTDLQTSVYQRFAIDPRSISYVEAHGTGTKLGDPIEIQSLTDSFRQWTPDSAFCRIGSVKTNIGHGVAAAGVAGLFKVLLALKHRQIPPSLHFTQPNENIDFAQTPFWVNTALTDWIESGQPLRAAINSFGFSGTNAHLVVEAAPDLSASQPALPTYLFPLSAKSAEALTRKSRNLHQWLLNGVADGQLGDLSYTLCRAHSRYSYRICIVADTVAELTSRLQDVTPQSPNSNQAGVTAKKAVDAPFTSFLNFQKQAGKAEYRAQMMAMAQVITAGGTYDWSALFAGLNSRVIALPAYPFARTTYWLTKKTPVQPIPDVQIRQTQPTTFVVDFSGKESFLTQHHYQNRSLLPGVAYLFLIQRIARRYFNTDVAQMRDVVWMGPFYYEAGESLLIDWSATPDPGSFRVSFYRGSLTSHNLIGQATADYVPTASPALVLDIERFRAKCQRPVLREDLYGAYEAMQIGYGDLFRPLQLAYVGSGVAWAELETPGIDDPYSEIYLLDGALQSALALQLESASGTPDLPFSIGLISFLQPLPRACSVYTQSVGTGLEPMHRSHLTLCDDEGTVLVHIQDFCQRPAGGGQAPVPPRNETESTPAKAQIVALEKGWQSTTVPTVLVPSGATLLVFDATRQLYDSLVGDLAFLGLNNRILWVQDETARKQGAPDLSVPLTTMNTSERYAAVWQYLRTQEGLNTDVYIVWNWSGLYTNATVPEFKHIDQTYALTDLVQSAAMNGVKTLRLVNLRVGAAEPVDPFYSGFSGFARTINKEFPAYSLTNLQYVPLAHERLAVGSVVVQELFAPVLPVEVHYNGARQRQVSQLRELAWPLATASSVLRRGQVILITGGAGGVGIALARQLGQRYGSKLILTGRSPFDAVIHAKISALVQEGIDVAYLPADIGNEADLQRLLAEIRTRHQSIQGVIHAAGQLRDGLFLNKTRQDWETVGRAKIQGLLHLHRLTQQDSLDFLLVCSSVSASTGNVGQSDYAYANAFMDAFVAYRNQQHERGQLSGKTYTINWPLWETGGMRLTFQQEQRLADEFGLYAMPDEVGMRVVEQLLASDRSALVVAYGDPTVLARQGLLGEPYQPRIQTQPVGAAPEPRSLEKTQSVMPAAEYRGKVEAIFVTELATLLQMPERDVVVSRPLSELGLDSILLNELAQRVYAQLQIRLSPTIFFEHRTIQAVVTYLMNEHRSVLDARFGNVGVPVTTPTPDPVLPRSVAPIAPASVASVLSVPTRTAREADSRIAIIGISGVFPGCQTVSEFYEKLKAGQSMLSPVPASRWDWERYYGNPLAEEHKTNVTHGGFIEGLDAFDAAFFGISPSEALLMDPQQRLFIEHTWKAIEDAGYALASFRERPTGVFVGAFTHEYEEMMLRNNIPMDFMGSTGNVTAIIANRISYQFDFKGPSEVVDTACSSSLVALHRAIQAIRSGECEQAIVGGVNALVSPYGFMAPAQARLLTSDDTIYSFDERANGYLRGEGAGVAILKRLPDALRDGDQVYGIVAGSAVTHGGRSYSLTAPNPAGQEDVIRRAFADAQLEPASVNYIEGHGTGTTLGDAVELNAYKRVFPPEAACAISTVKPNIGHLEAASGITSLFKVLLSMQDRQILPVRNFVSLQPDVTLADTGLHITQRLTPWESLRNAQGDEQPLRASLHSFGFGGVNAHLILENYPNPPVAGECRMPTNLFLFSATDTPTLLRSVEQFVAYGEAHPQVDLRRVAYTLQLGREAMPVRFALTADRLDELLDALRQFVRTGGVGEVPRGASNIRETTSASMETLLQDQAFLTTLLEQAVVRQSYQHLLSLWVLGANFDWKTLYAVRPTCLALPTYPFNKKRYWVLDRGQSTPSTASAQPSPESIVEPPADSSDGLIRTCADILGVTVQDVSEERSLIEQGMTSIQKIRFKYELEQKYGISISMPQLGNANSLRDLRTLVTQLGNQNALPIE